MKRTESVLLYTHGGCPGGDAARRYFDQVGMPYRVCDVLQDAAAHTEFKRLGGIGTPLLVVGDLVMHGFDPEEFERLMAAT
ncbi:MAG TPA: glutaredoxin domain-containing protein [Symbiobacteriaceae bacterium]|jgi:glutaredoxin